MIMPSGVLRCAELLVHSINIPDLDVIIVHDVAVSFSMVTSQGEICLIMGCPHKLERTKGSGGKYIIKFIKPELLLSLNYNEMGSS